MTKTNVKKKAAAKAVAKKISPKTTGKKKLSAKPAPKAAKKVATAKPLAAKTSAKAMTAKPVAAKATAKVAAAKAPAAKPTNVKDLRKALTEELKSAKKTTPAKAAAIKTTAPAKVEEKLDPGMLSTGQVRALDKLIQKNADWENIQNHLKLNPTSYDMSKVYQDKMAIQHPKLGLGYVMEAENDRMRVLFSDGARNLIMNYKK